MRLRKTPPAGSNQSLSRDLIWMAIGQGALIVSQWGVLTSLARRSDAQTVGQFALALAIAAPIVMFTRLQLRSILASDARHTHRFEDYLALRGIATGLSVLAIAGVVLVGGYSTATVTVTVLVALARAAESMSDICYGFFQTADQIGLVARSLILRSAGTAIMLGLTLLWAPNAALAAVALLVPWAVVFVFHDLPVTQRLKGRQPAGAANDGQRPGRGAHMSVLLALSRVALPLGVVTMAASLTASIPRYFVEALLGEASLGVFAALAYASVPGTVLTLSLGQTVIARMSRQAAARDTAGFARLLAGATGFALLLAIGGVMAAKLVGAWSLKLLYGPEYAQHVDLLVWIMIGAGVAYLATVLIDALTAARGFRIQVPLAIAAALIQIIACAFLVPAQGMIGAAKALVLARSFQLVGNGLALSIILRRPSPPAPQSGPFTAPNRALDEKVNA
jgi:O-antigen/teichoic acid export membrane protein